ncbi:hypothetical protein BDFB_014893 [Asbolus verrucosus]|uniref:DDE 3 domain containing protein n=1 Tax=Asbolus verrucosus TaxID=1661398 RepID=A0A482W6R1_ASBVE|nr:hypothetical protein BDFB_014893 [Asbolus verrucosus]
MLPLVRRGFPNNNFIFQQDTQVHRSGIVRDWIEQNEINVLPWLPRIPDLNPI